MAGAGNTAQPVNGTVSYDDLAKTAKFTPQPALVGSDEGTVYTVSVIGSNSQPILDIDSLALDSNGDGQEGGDFESKFTIKTVTIIT